MTTHKSKPAARPAPRSLKEMRPVDRAFIYAVMFELGILPIEDPSYDMRRPTKESLSKEETRTLNRRFRKMWRKYMRQQIHEEMQSTTVAAGTKEHRVKAIKKSLGVNKRTPAQSDRLARKRLVYESIWSDYVVPMLQRFEDPAGQPG